MASDAVVPRRVWGEEIEIAFRDPAACSVHASMFTDCAGLCSWKPVWGRTAIIGIIMLLCAYDKKALSFQSVIFGTEEGVVEYDTDIVNVMLLDR